MNRIYLEFFFQLIFVGAILSQLADAQSGTAPPSRVQSNPATRRRLSIRKAPRRWMSSAGPMR